MKINFHYDIDKFRIKEGKKIKAVASKIVKQAGYKGGRVEIIFTTDDKLLEINIEFLDHNYLTDIITFDYKSGHEINGEIYISLERVKDNSNNLGTKFNSEIKRVIFHGFLHLCGYSDNTVEERRRMQEMEELYLDMSEAE